MGVGLRDVFDDEELLAGLDETELAAREVLDCAGVILESLGLFAQPTVLRAHIRKGLLERAILLALLHHLEQALFSDQRVEDQHAPDEDEEVLHGATAAATLVRNAGAGRFGGLLLQALSTGTP